jgi:hypothetical protein
MIFPGGKPTMFMSILMFGEPGVPWSQPIPLVAGATPTRWRASPTAAVR